MTLTLDTGWLALVGTKAWDMELRDFPVPTFRPWNNQTHLYFADALRMYRPTLTDVQKKWVLDNLVSSALLFKRFESGDPLSHDELLGIAFYLWYLELTEEAKKFLDLLMEKGGQLTTDSVTALRILEIEPCLQSAAGWTPSPWSQIAFSLRLLSRAFTKLDGNGSSFNRAWISIPLMARFGISGAAILIFAFIMKVRKITVHDMTLHYWTHIPPMVEAAKEKSWLE
jgi:hypothetical protein